MSKEQRKANKRLKTIISKIEELDSMVGVDKPHDLRNMVNGWFSWLSHKEGY